MNHELEVMSDYMNQKICQILCIKSYVKSHKSEDMSNFMYQKLCQIS